MFCSVVSVLSSLFLTKRRKVNVCFKETLRNKAFCLNFAGCVIKDATNKTDELLLLLKIVSNDATCALL